MLLPSILCGSVADSDDDDDDDDDDSDTLSVATVPCLSRFQST